MSFRENWLNKLSLQYLCKLSLLLMPLGIIATISTPTSAACERISGSLDPAAKSYVRDTLGTYNGCTIPLRNGDSNFGYQHLLKRDREVGNHGWSTEDKYYTQLALNRQPFLVNTGYYAYSYPRSANGTQCVFVDFKAFEGYPYKGLITSYHRNPGNLTPRQCAGK